MSGALDSARVAEDLVAYAQTHLLARGTALTADTPLLRAGLDSFSIVELLLFAEGTYGVRVPEAALTHENLATMAALAACIASLAGSSGLPPG